MAVAAMLPDGVDVVVLERESQLAAHSTGRSAALFYETYGDASSIRLATASRQYIADRGFLGARGALTVAPFERADEIAAIASRSLDDGAEIIQGIDRLRDMCDTLRAPVAIGLFEPNVADLDVMGLHAHFVGYARRRSVDIRTGAEVMSISRDANKWHIETGQSVVRATTLVNAAGAWGDVIAKLAGVAPVALKPLRRTAFTTAGVTGSSVWPAVADIDHAWYFKPEGPQLLCSPAEEHEDVPGDPKPRMEDVALAIDRINAVTDLGIRSVAAEWTGFRTFAPDRRMVIGFDASAPGFFWLVGQGGTGIQTSPAAGALATLLIAGEMLEDDIRLDAIEPIDYSPNRLRRSP